MRTRGALVLTVLALTIGGCASTNTGTAGSAPAPSNSSGCPKNLVITAHDSQKTVCVALGGTVELRLASNGGGQWTEPELGGNNLTELGIDPSAAPDTLVKEYQAATVGTAVITSSHPACPPATGGAVSCHAIVSWKVTVDVKS